MRLIRFLDVGGRERLGALQADGGAIVIQGDLLGEYRVTTERVGVKKVLAPVRPPVIFAIGQNYRRHAAEMGAKISEFPVVFMKSPACVQNPGDAIEKPVGLKSDEVDFEAELAVVIGKRCKNVSKADALKYVLGYTVANDVTARDWQKQFGGSQWCRGKTFDTFCPLGPAIVTPEEAGDPNKLWIRSTLNGKVMQDSNTSDMIFSVETLIAFLSGSTTLLPGTVILTGTPEGVGAARTPPVWLKAGDELVMSVEKLGELRNPVVEEAVSK